VKVKIENIGMVKKADVKLDGLTIIAGENDTGKSTLGKILFAVVKADNIRRKSKKTPQEVMATWLNLVFDRDVSSNGDIKLIDDNKREIINLHIKDDNYIEKYDFIKQGNRPFFDATFIQTPIVFDMIDFFDSVARLKEMQRMEMGAMYGIDFDFSYPVIFWDLYAKITNKNPFPKAINWKNIYDMIQEIIGGEFKKEDGKISFNKYLIGKKVEVKIANTAFGIKSFGLLQLLNNNGYLNKKYILILDEPEVHLHPEWQLKYAKIIVELVNNGIYVVVNTHSPYMLQALKFYSDKIADVKNRTNFYLAEKKDGDINSVIVDKTNDLNAIFQKLSKPLQDIVWG